MTQADLQYKKASLLNETPMHYCPGCTHGAVHKIVAEVIKEIDIAEDTIGIAPVGCAAFMYKYIDVDWQQAAHGRAPAVATGIKRVFPNKHVFTYQGDGDLAAIGTSETVHTCNRGENIVIVFINNGIYGMTGGQMAPTTLMGQTTSTTPDGREFSHDGAPIKISDLLAKLDGTCYVTRQAAHTAQAVRKCKKAITKAFEMTERKLGTAIVEVVASCNEGWGMNPVEANNWMAEHMFAAYPLGDLKDNDNAALTKARKEWDDMEMRISRKLASLKNTNSDLSKAWSNLHEQFMK